MSSFRLDHGFFTRDRLSRLLLAVFAMTAVLGPAPAAFAASTASGPYFGAGNFPPGCEGDMVPGTPEYWYVAGEGGLTGGDSSSQALCHHMRLGLNYLDSPEVDVLILVPATVEVEREMRQARQSMEMWEQGIDFLAKDMGLDWLADGMNFHVTVDTFDPSGEGGEFTTYPIVDPEIVIVQGLNPVGHVGIGIDPVGSFTGENSLCHGIPNVLDIEAWENLPGFDRHHEERGGNYREDCGGEGGNVCFAVNSRLPSAFGEEAMFDLVSHEVGHCLTIGHVGDGAEGAWGGLPPDDIMAYDEGGAGAKCVSTLDVEGIAIRMSRYLDVNGDGQIDAADLLKANDQTGQGGNAFQVQHPSDHYYASSTGKAIDCPQPDMGLVPGERTSWTPARTDVQTTPTLNVNTPQDGTDSANATVTVAGTVEHLEDEVEKPNGIVLDDPAADGVSPAADYLELAVEATATHLVATGTFTELATTDDPNTTLYRLVVGDQYFDSTLTANGEVRTSHRDSRGGTTAPSNVVPEATSTWDTDAKTITWTVERPYLAQFSQVAPYAVAGWTYTGLLLTLRDDLVPNSGTAQVNAPASDKLSTNVTVPSVGEQLATVTFEHEGGNTFFTEESTGGVDPLGTAHSFTLDVASASDVTITLAWTDATGGSDLDLAVTGAATGSSGDFNALTEAAELVELTGVAGRLNITVDPYLITDPVVGVEYTLTAEVTPLDLGPDTDGDGVLDADDACPTVAGTGPDGCPIADRDGDGVADDDDVCPDLAGEGADGCPIAATETVDVYVDDVLTASQAVDTVNGADSFSIDVTLDEGTHLLRTEWVDEGTVLATDTRMVTHTPIENPTPILSATGDTAEEAEAATLDVNLRLDVASEGDVVVEARTTEAGTATAGADFTPVDTLVTIPAGVTTWTISIPVLDDELVESTETVHLDLAVVAGDATFADGGSTRTVINQITDADDQPVPDSDVNVTAIDGNAPESRTFVDANRGFSVDGTATVPQKKEEQGPNGDLVADAGNSSHVAIGSLANVQGASFGGTSPYTFAWSFDGAADRFADASKAGTTFDTTGLTAGRHQLKLTVTDGDGVVDTDTVAISVFAGGSGQLYDEVGTMSVSAFSFETDDHHFAVPAGASSMTIAVRWDDDGVSDLDLTATAPNGTETSSEQISTSEEVLVVEAPAAGDWLVEVRAFTSIPLTYTITVDAEGGVSAPDPTPVVTLPAAFDFTVGAPQVLTGSVAGGTDPVLTWDTNLDGAPDGTGTSITTNLPAGQHLVSLKATDAMGYEHRVVTAVRVGDVVGSGASVVVISVIDTGINLYHDDFSADTFTNQAILDLTNNFTKHPSEYLPGYPAATPALNLDLNGGYFPASDQATINNVQLGKLYWVPGTKVIAIRDDGSATGVDTVKMLDEDGHGTASASVAAGNVYGFCPSCLLAIGEGFNSTAAGIEENEDYYHRQKWVDITSNSFGPQANVGFGPLTTPPQPKASAEGGQIAMYAAGNGAANAFIVPVQTYLPPSTGPDWIVRVGAAHAQRRQPILGDGNPVDITSFGAGTILAAGIGGTRTVGSHSGTSSATPKSAGALGLVLGSARTTMGDTTNGWANGIVASGTPAGSGALSDGVLTRRELLTAFFKTTEHERNGSVFIPVQATMPYTEFQYLFEGYGLADPASAARAIDVLEGALAMPVRTLEDQFFREFDEPIRDFLYGNYAETADADNGGDSLVFGSSNAEVSTTELMDVLTNGTGEDLFAWWSTNIGELPRLATSSHGSTNQGSVEVAIVTDGTQPQATDWVAADDTSTSGDFTTWSAGLDGLAPGTYTVHARVVDLAGEVLATDGPFDVTVNRPFDPSCPVYNTRLGDDIAGDAILFDEQGLPSALSTPALDVIAVDARTLADGSVEWTLQVTDLDEAYSGVGERYEVNFSAGTDAFALVAGRSLRDETGVFVVDPTFMIVKNDGAEQPLTGAFDAAAETISWIVPPTVFDGANTADLAAASELSFTGAEGQRDNFTGYHAADGLASNGCAFYIGQDIRIPALASLADVEVAENGSSVSMTVTLDRQAVDDETVLVSTTDGTATAGSDYVALADHVVTFANGEAQATFTVDLLDDLTYEGDEQFVVSLSPGHDTTTDASSVATVTIVEDDAAPVLDATGASVDEAAGATLDVVLTLDAPAVGDVAVRATTIDLGGADEATPGSDYTPVDDTFTIADGTSTVTVQIPVLDDDTAEELEVVNLDLEILGTNATFADGLSTSRVANHIADPADQALPTITITGGTVDEPAFGQTADLTFTVEVAGDVRESVIVDLEIAGGTATAADHDGLSTTQLVFDAPGQQVVTVGVLGDHEVEGDETVVVGIVEGSAANAVLASERTAVGTIIDTTPAEASLSIGDVEVVEGSGGQQTAKFVVTLDRPVRDNVEVLASTLDGTAVAGDDYIGRQGVRVLIPAGATSAEFHVAVESDKKVELDEAFTVTLTGAVNATIGDGEAIATILDDDLVSASIKGFSIKEDTAGAIGPIEVEVKLDQAPVVETRIRVTSLDGGKKAAATAGQDYDAVDTWVTFQPGQTVATFLVTIHDDEVAEDTETFTLRLMAGDGHDLKHGDALVTIRDND